MFQHILDWAKHSLETARINRDSAQAEYRAGRMEYLAYRRGASQFWFDWIIRESVVRKEIRAASRQESMA